MAPAAAAVLLATPHMACGRLLGARHAGPRLSPSRMVCGLANRPLEVPRERPWRARRRRCYHAAEQLDRALEASRTRASDRRRQLRVVELPRYRAPCAAYVERERTRVRGSVNAALALLEDNRADVLLVNPDAVVTPSPSRARVIPTPAGECTGRSGRPRLIGLRQRPARPLAVSEPMRMCAEAVGLGRLQRAAGSPSVPCCSLGDAVDDVGRSTSASFSTRGTDWQRRRAVAAGPRRLHAGDRDHEGAGTSRDARRREALFHRAGDLHQEVAWSRRWWCYRAAAFAGAADGCSC